MTDFSTEAERRAAVAASLPAFANFNLAGLRREVARMLTFIGRSGFFDQYTMHDISHIDEMLRSLDWIIPEPSKELLTPADWALIVLSVYFHDMGMLVTPNEYAARNSSEFPRYCRENLFGGLEGADYRARVEETYPDADKLERFLYQEFVRHTHARRVAAWILAESTTKLGLAHEVAEATDSLLSGLDPTFRTDLALVCESHHLDDLADARKYRVSRPYGNDPNEAANVQYAAILLRTADLLHITRDRTPSIAFRLINPTDPVSQVEWAKQRAVRSVRRQIGRNAENVPDENAERNTVEVHATFTDADGFFGLTSYLTYAQGQLRKSNEWIQSSRRNYGVRVEFPWRRIDDSNVEARGFYLSHSPLKSIKHAFWTC